MSSPPVIHVAPATKPSALKRTAKGAVRLAALAGVSPVLASYWISAAIVGKGRALESRSQLLSLWPGLTGQYLRRAFLQQVLAGCHPSATVEFGTFFSQPGAILEENVYVGPRCILGLVHLERDVLIGPCVQIPSGGQTHYFDDPTRPIREQGGERKLVTVGAGSWIGAGAIVLADVGKGTVVAAGSVVTKPLPDNVIAGGVPAKVIRDRFAQSETGPTHG
ncbi:MAG: acyltransferase [Gemmataceae bacterium]|nr:acyltransferase [Gemmataceae bacterium]